ncbi:2-hydroxyglutaryl-CoA dehydratase [Peptococcus simiae]|uniref:2-hydroxyglutaryl-CoA dehydratase n=1 Tax=Peptococcus simiae TaxID=1643805 RepID=A0ABW9GXM2_9FIRM
MSTTNRVVFTEEMKETHTILVPMMLPIHFKFLQRILEMEGYKIDVLTGQGQELIDTGLKYTHNDTCYPAQLTIGQLMQAALSGKYDTDRIALLLMQTGGGCRASNYVSLLRKALKQAHMEHIPVLSFNLLGLEKNPGFTLSKDLIHRMAVGVLYGDVLMDLYNQTLPYEVHSGDCDALVETLVEELCDKFKRHEAFKDKDIVRESRDILQRFSEIEVREEERIRVGIVGEIYVKFAPLGNNNLEAFLRSEGAEVVVPGLMDFVLYTIDAGIEDNKLYGTGFIKRLVSEYLYRRVIRLQNNIIDQYADYPRFKAPAHFEETKGQAAEIVHVGTKMGEGWLLTGEMVELINSGVNNIVCTQPFGCLPNHIVGRGMMRKIKEIYPEANIVPIDYDASATQVNQENRLKLMLSSARSQANKKPL